MDWKTIMEMEDPHEALKAIAIKIEQENLTVEEMEDRMEEYAERHGISTWEMAYYPDGDQVLKYPL